MRNVSKLKRHISVRNGAVVVGKNRSFKEAVRARMRKTGETYKTAQRALIEERAKEIGGVVDGTGELQANTFHPSMDDQ